MSDAAATDLLAQMKTQRVKQGRLAGRDFYSKILVNKNKRRSLIAAAFLVFIAFTTFLFSHQYTENHWLVVAGPVVFLGSLLCLVPPTEGWIYTAWQTNPQKYERHFLD